MLYRELGSTGLRVSALALGTNRLRNCARSEVDAVLNHLLDRGVNFISTGVVYEVQDRIGAAVAHRRSEFVLSSKATQPTAEGVRRGLDESRRALRTDYFDIYEMDFVNDDASLRQHLGVEGAYDALLEAQAKGIVRHIGTSSHRPDVIARLVGSGFVESVTMMTSLVHQYGLAEVLPLARERGVGTIAMRPIDHGALRDTERALAFALHSGVDTVLSGMTSVAQVDANVDSAERALAMPADEVTALLAEAASLPTSGCRNCEACRCPYDIRLGYVLPVYHYRARYGLTRRDELGPLASGEPTGEEMWARNVERARLAAPNCATCRRCEVMCPYGVPIVDYVARIARSD